MQSHDKAKRLHRDITPGNIILLNPGLTLSPGISRKGYLVDWDLSRKQEDAGLRQESEVSVSWFIDFNSAPRLTLTRRRRHGSSWRMPSALAAICTLDYLLRWDLCDTPGTRN